MAYVLSLAPIAWIESAVCMVVGGHAVHIWQCDGVAASTHENVGAVLSQRPGKILQSQAEMVSCAANLLGANVMNQASRGLRHPDATRYG